MGRRPDLRYERRLWKVGLTAVAGVDEVGVGPIAGPVVAAAVIFTPELFISGVDDSKRLTPQARSKLYPVIRERALAVGIGVAEVEEIDRFNVYWAALEACRRSLAELDCPPDHVLVDGRRIPELPWPQTHLIGGDRLSFCVAAASIVAKVTRDRMMCEYDRRYPGYGFARHKGYCTAEHLAQLRRLGPSPLHRRSFAPVAAASQLELALKGRPTNPTA